MKWKLGLLVAFLAIFAVVKAEDDVEIPDDFSLEDEDEELLRNIEEEHINADIKRENELASRIATEALDNANKVNSPRAEVDPCKEMHCGPGKICLPDGLSARCECIPDCPIEDNPRRRVCTNRNETWASDCEVYRQKCLCDTKHKNCKGEEYKHVHIDYYGECKDLPDCTEEEKNDFPRRMRDWLFNVMRDLAERAELNDYYMQMELEAETNLTRRWGNAAVWKWCDLDGDGDRSVSRHELFPIRAPLVSLEHCIAPFLESCDKNNDHRITLKEWGQCLELDEEDIIDRCDDLQSHPDPSKPKEQKDE